MNPLLERQLEQLNEHAPGRCSYRELRPSGGCLVIVSGVALPTGWNKQSTAIRFIAPVGYPFAAPDCFWADSDLRLMSGTGVPKAAVVQTIPETTDVALWFSWHVAGWNPNKDTLVRYLNICKTRLANLE